jgi:DNA-binding NarL/FixJ family response regulator
MDAIRVLIADELSIVRLGVISMFNKQNDFNVVGEVGSFKDVISYLNNNHNSVDVILMDVKFTESCGIITTKTILETNKDAKIIALTSEQKESTIFNMINAGVQGYVLKEEANELLDAIREVAKGNKYYSKKVSIIMISSLINGCRANINYKISRREKEILIHVANGKSNKEVAGSLDISCRTVETHRRNIMRKLSLKNSAEMVRYAITNKLVA